MQFPDAIKSCFKNYVNFSGRAPRSEYWFWFLFLMLVSVVASILDTAIFSEVDPSPLYSVSMVILLFPNLAVAARRLHDRNYSGWWLLISLTGIGMILLIIWFCMRGTPGPNRFGSDPLAGTAL